MPPAGRRRHQLLRSIAECGTAVTITRNLPKLQLFKVENIHNYSRPAIPENNMTTDDDAFAVRRRWRHSAVQIGGNKDDAAFQGRRKGGVNYELVFLIGRQIISSGESRRKMSVIFGVPVANLAAIVIGESVAAAVVVIVTVFMAFARISPMSIVVIAIPVVAISVITVLVISVSLAGKHGTS
jgi:hypothetical protein